MILQFPIKLYNPVKTIADTVKATCTKIEYFCLRMSSTTYPKK